MGEGKNKSSNSTNLIIAVIVLLAVVYFIYYSLPMLVSLASNIFTLGIMLLVIGGILFVVLNPKIRNGIFNKVGGLFKK